MRTKILVPLDGSQVAEAALDQALKMATSEEVELRILNAWPHNVAIDASADAKHVERVREEHRGYLRKWKDKLASEGVNVSATLVEEDPVPAILSVAREEEIDLIVMSSHGRSGLTRLVLGSVAEQVVRGAPCPVLLLGRDYLEQLGFFEESS